MHKFGFMYVDTKKTNQSTKMYHSSMLSIDFPMETPNTNISEIKNPQASIINNVNLFHFFPMRLNFIININCYRNFVHSCFIFYFFIFVALTCELKCG